MDRRHYVCRWVRFIRFLEVTAPANRCRMFCVLHMRFSQRCWWRFKSSVALRPCRLVNSYRCFSGACCLHLQGQAIRPWRWKYCALWKCRWLFIGQHDITTQKTCNLKVLKTAKKNSSSSSSSSSSSALQSWVSLDLLAKKKWCTNFTIS